MKNTDCFQSSSLGHTISAVVVPSELLMPMLLLLLEDYGLLVGPGAKPPSRFLMAGFSLHHRIGFGIARHY